MMSVLVMELILERKGTCIACLGESQHDRQEHDKGYHLLFQPCAARADRSLNRFCRRVTGVFDLSGFHLIRRRLIR